jgi:glycine/sarcosine N-methyltransferase
MLYDTFSSDYDRFVNWLSRLEVELPFLETQLREANAQNILDAACGTGMHAIALARLGFEVSGADLSKKMIGRARSNAQLAGVPVHFKPAGFGQLRATFGRQSFNAVICMGNSLPHLLTPRDLSAALLDFGDCLKPGGIVIIQNRNFDEVMKKKERWMEPQHAREGKTEWFFLRFYDFKPDGLLTFNIITLHRDETNDWKQSILSTPLRPILSQEMRPALQAAGFHSVEFYGDMTGSQFNPDVSGNLVVIARITGK